MKVSTNHYSPTSNGRRQIVPIVPLQRPEKKDLTKGDYVTLKCKTRPGDRDSATYDLPIPYFKSGTPEEFLKWKRNVEKAISGQGATDGPSKYTLTRRLLDGNALTAFNLKAEEFQTETNPNFLEVIEDLTRHVFPIKALQTQKRYMRRFLRKPRDMKTREYVSRVCEINEMLVHFPTADQESKLPNDEMLDLLEFGMPSSWQKAMILQDFDPVDHTIPELVSFCERLELTEPELEKKSPKNDSSSSSSSKKRKKVGFQRDRDNKLEGDCLLHGKNCGHDTHDCRTMKRHAEAVKKKYSDNVGHINSNREVQTIFNEAFMNFMDNKKARKKKSTKRSAKELKNFEELKLDESDSDESDRKMFSSDSESDDDDKA